jgi:hypothetical protein
MDSDGDAAAAALDTTALDEEALDEGALVVLLVALPQAATVIANAMAIAGRPAARKPRASRV